MRIRADTGHYALIKVRDGAVLADGDEVFTSRDAAVEAFARARALGWDLYATPGLLTGGADRDVTELDVSSLAAVPENVLRRAPFTRIGRAHVALALLLPAAIASVWIAWLQRDALLDWITGPEPVVAAPPSEPDLAIAVDSVTLIEACRRALIDYPPWLPAWRIESLACTARLADPELAALRPELAGRAVMLARWRLGSGHAEPLHRQVAEQHLSRWYAASVVDARAWAVAPAGPRAAHRRDTRRQLFLALRRAVDRELGLRGARIDYAAARKAAGPSGSAIPARCLRLADLFREAAGLAGLEITALDRGADGGWRLHGRPVAPEAMTLAEFRELTGAPAPEAERNSEQFPNEEATHE